MRATIVGGGWPLQAMAAEPCDSYMYYCGGTLQLEEFIQRNHGKHIVGIVSYDLGYELHGIAPTKSDDLALPDAYFMAFETYAPPVFSAGTAALTTPFVPQLSRQEYNHAFEKIQQHIYEGDIYQVNLTHRLYANSAAEPWDLFSTIARQNPATMAAYLEGPGFEVLSFSPEKFISIKNGFIETSPIKGTRPTGQEAELLASEKETAELNMITDLLRNDLGKVCQAGTVKVTAHRKLMQLPNISHTYSHITGQLKPNITPIGALLSMFPGGSITGCPKKRAMEIINDLEPTTRSAYCGSMVVIEPNGDLHSSILIRTIIKKGQQLLLPVGGGIVVDSKLKDEYQETLDKAAAIIQALPIAE